MGSALSAKLRLAGRGGRKDNLGGMQNRKE